MSDLLKLFTMVFSLTAFSFGGGFTIQASLEREMVAAGMITPQEFAAGVAIGQTTPGPQAAFLAAIGQSAAGVPGGLAATFGLLAVSWIVIMVILRVPRSWFEWAPARAGLRAIPLYVTALLFFLAFRVGRAGDMSRLAGPLLLLVLAFVGRRMKVPAPVLVLGAIGLAMMMAETPLAGW
jgi:chromate transporter